MQARSFAEMLEQTIRRYQNRAVEAAQVIEELIGLAREMREANARGEALGLSDDELAFYDALGVSDSAVQVLGRRDTARYRPRAGRDPAGQCDHRLDAAGARPRQTPRSREARATEARLPTGQTRGRDADRAGANGGSVRWVDRLTSFVSAGALHGPQPHVKRVANQRRRFPRASLSNVRTVSRSVTIRSICSQSGFSHPSFAWNSRA